MTTPSVAVVIPTRDRHGLVRLAVASALAQTYPPAEVWVVDDGSARPADLGTDDPRVRLVRLPAATGSAHARNVAVERSTSELVAFLDDDDTWRPDKLRRQVDVLSAAGDRCAAVETGYELRDLRGCVLLRFIPIERRDVRLTLLERPLLQPSTTLVRRSAFAELGGFPTDLQRTEDWSYALRLAERYEVAVVPEVLVDRLFTRRYTQAMLDGLRGFVRGEIEPRLAALPEQERARIVAAHLQGEARILVGLGRTAEARRLLVRAWRVAGDPGALARALVTFGGEPAYRAADRVHRRILHPALRLLGRDPVLERY